MTDDLNELARLWLLAKEDEQTAISERRRIEDRIKSLGGVSENLEGTEKLSPEGYTIRIVGRLDRKVDGDLLQDLAAEHGLTDHLGTLFRWKPEVNLAAWKAADDRVTTLLTGAITTKASRPTFTILPKE